MAEKKKPAKPEVAEKLGVVLASSYALQLKIQNFHWNVTGMNFIQLHELFEKLYDDVDEAVDVIAERIRAIGPFAPGGLSAFAKMSEIKDAPAKPPGEKGMLQQLASDQEAMSKLCADVCELADDAEDKVTADLMTQRMNAHDKNAWFLRAHLE
jgi:starvation-inducible DNA-binding protein